MAQWPDGARGALSLSFDNLGEAAELELGALEEDAELGDHFTATRMLPKLLTELMLRNLQATFFVEGLNAELYPAPLLSVHIQNHELGYHAWRHEQWSKLSAAEQAENLARGRTAFTRLAVPIRLAGLRPPGGGLGPGGVEVLRDAGLRYCSPAGAGAGVEDGIAMLPFEWRHVDASCLIPDLAPIREQMVGWPDPIEPKAFLDYIETEVDRLVDEGGYMAIVLHLSLLEWLGWDRLRALLSRVRAAKEEEIWVAPCVAVADHVLSQPEDFLEGTTLDPTTWTG